MLTTIFNWFFVYPLLFLLFIFFGIPGLLITGLLLCLPLFLLFTLLAMIIKTICGEK